MLIILLILLSINFLVEVIRNKKLYRQSYSKGIPKSKLELISEINKSSGTSITFSPDPEIFGNNSSFSPEYLFTVIQNKAYLSPGVKIHWKCNKDLLANDNNIPFDKVLHFQNGIKQLLIDKTKNKNLLVSSVFYEKIEIHRISKIFMKIIEFDKISRDFYAFFQVPHGVS